MLLYSNDLNDDEDFPVWWNNFISVRRNEKFLTGQIADELKEYNAFLIWKSRYNPQINSNICEDRYLRFLTKEGYVQFMLKWS